MKWKVLCGLALCLAACEPKTEPKIVCEVPQLGQVFKNDLDTQFNHALKQALQNDTQHWLNPTKAMMLTNMWGLHYTLPKWQSTQQVCQTELSITIPDAVWKTARKNKVLFNNGTLDEALSQRLIGSTVRLEQGALVFPIQYDLNAKSKPISVQYRHTDWTTLSKALSLISSSYAFNDVIKFHGRLMSPEQAVQSLMQTNHAVQSAETVAVQNPLVSQTVQTIASSPVELSSGTEVLQPNLPEKIFNSQDLQEAKRIYQEAGTSLKQTWQNIDEHIRQYLENEQQQWEMQRHQNCRRAAQRTQNQNHADYLYMQCDTRMTRERVQYLRSYELPQ